jgi:hypothetical protein
MKKLVIFSLFALVLSAPVMTSCVKAKPGCKKNYKKIQKMRKNNPNFKV